MVSWEEAWYSKKIPKRAEISVQYCDSTKNDSEVVALLVRDIFTRDFTLFKVDHKEKKLVSLGKSKSPNKLEKAHLKPIKDKTGYEIV